MMNNLLHFNESPLFGFLRRFVVALVAGVLLLLTTTACSPADTVSSGMAVPAATTEAVNQAQDNLSDKAVDENALSRQSPSLAK